MRYPRPLLAAALLALAPAACTQAPTHSADDVQARLDGGPWIGSGNDSGSAVPPPDGEGFTTADADNPVATDTTGRGGHTIGGGA